MEHNQSTTKLDMLNANHIRFKHDKLNFDILGGINPENYHSLRIMLVTQYGRKKHRDNVDLLNHDQVSNYIARVSELTMIHRDKIRKAINELTNELEEYKLELQNAKGKSELKTYQIHDEEREKAIAFLKEPELLARLNELFGEAGVIGNRVNRMVLFLAYLTRKTNTSLHAVIQSEYDYLQNRLSGLIPEEDIVSISYISENGLFYFNEEAFQNKVLLVEDTVSNRRSLSPLLAFQKRNQLSRTTVVKDEYAELVTVQKRIRGNVSLSISTRDQQAFSQNGALSLVVQEDSGKAMDEEVLMYQRKQSAGLVSSYQESQIAKQIQNIQRVLSTVTVINPYAMEIQLPSQIRNKQITNLHYLRFIEIITFLKQYQREQRINEATGEVYIESTLEDIREANELLSEILLNNSDQLNKPTRTFLEGVKCLIEDEKVSEEGFTLLELSIALNAAKTTLGRYVRTLVESGFMKPTGKGDRKNGYQYELVNPHEYSELRASVNSELKRSEITIENKLRVVSTSEVHQNESGALKSLKTNKITEVHHNLKGGIEEKRINRSKRKAG